MAFNKGALERALKNYKLCFGIAAAVSAFVLTPKFQPLISSGTIPIFFSYLTSACLFCLLMGLVFEVFYLKKNSKSIPVHTAVLGFILFGLFVSNTRRTHRSNVVSRLQSYDDVEGLERLFRARDPFVRALVLELSLIHISEPTRPY